MHETIGVTVQTNEEAQKVGGRHLGALSALDPSATRDGDGARVNLVDDCHIGLPGEDHIHTVMAKHG